MQIGRIRTINTPRLKKPESKPANQVEIPLSDQSSDGKFRVCQRDSRRNKFETNEQKPKDSQNQIGAPSAGQQKVSIVIKIKVDSKGEELSRPRAGTEASAHRNKTQ